MSYDRTLDQLPQYTVVHPTASFTVFYHSGHMYTYTLQYYIVKSNIYG